MDPEKVRNLTRTITLEKMKMVVKDLPLGMTKVTRYPMGNF